MVLMTPEGSTFDVYDQNFADNKQYMTNEKGELRPPMHVHKKFIVEDDHANINSVLVMDYTVN